MNAPSLTLTGKLILIAAILAAFATTMAHAQFAPNSICKQADLNRDGVVDVQDLLILLGQWGHRSYDLNCDGVVDGKDAGILIDNFGYRNPQWFHGDLNGDGQVDFVDLRFLLRSHNRRSSDLNCNGTVGFGDLDILLGCWGAGSELPPPPVPDIRNHDLGDSMVRESLIEELSREMDRPVRRR